MRSDHEAIQELLVFWPEQADPVFVILHLDISVFLIGILGMTRPLLILADGLVATSPPLNASRHDPIRGPKFGIPPSCGSPAFCAETITGTCLNHNNRYVSIST